MNREGLIGWLIEHPKTEWGKSYLPGGWEWFEIAAGEVVARKTGHVFVKLGDFMQAESKRVATRAEVLQWCVDTLGSWPFGDTFIPTPPDGWKWSRHVHVWTLLRADSMEMSISASDFDKATFNREPPIADPVKSPKHYAVVDDVEAITIIASSLTVEEWRGYCLGNIMKYRLRAGKKDELTQDIAKADEYCSLFERYKHLNQPTRAKNNERLVQEKA